MSEHDASKLASFLNASSGKACLSVYANRRAFLWSVTALVAVAAAIPPGVNTAVAQSQTAEAPTAEQLSQGLPVQKTTMTIGVAGLALVYLPYYVAAGLGYYEEIERQLGVSVRLLDFPGGVQAINALVAGQVNIMVGAAPDAITASARGQDVVITSSIFNSGNIQLTAGKLSGITDVAQLEGRTIALSSIGSGAYVQTIAIAKAYGLDVDKINFLGLGAITAVLPGLTSGRVDVMAVGEPSSTDAEMKGIGNIIIDLFDKEQGKKVFPGGFVGIGTVTTTRFINANPGALQAFIYQTIRAANWIKDNIDRPEEIAKTLPEALRGTDQAVLNSFFKRAVDVLSLDGAVADSALQEVIRVQVDTGIIEDGASIDLSKVVDSSFANRADAALRQP